MIAHGPVSDHLAVGAMDFRSPQWHPGGEGPADENVVPDDATWRSTRPLSWGRYGQHVDVEVVVSGEGDRFLV
ncbi:hypothetical protein [Streptomyces sp. NPDC126514]|uniref:hypothetical protein n=1 Tax=Streptomyces sp. NPDC126514 TaxID=3155210 RepID=UPI00332F6951